MLQHDEENDNNNFPKNMLVEKIRYYRILTKELGIKNDITFNYDEDCKKYQKKITNKNLLKQIDKIKKIFNLRDAEYKDFDKENGWFRLYQMTISICQQLFGDQIINTRIVTIQETNKLVKVRKYTTNIEFYNVIQDLI